MKPGDVDSPAPSRRVAAAQQSQATPAALHKVRCPREVPQGKKALRRWGRRPKAPGASQVLGWSQRPRCRRGRFLLTSLPACRRHLPVSSRARVPVSWGRGSYGIKAHPDDLTFISSVRSHPRVSSPLMFL